MWAIGVIRAISTPTTTSLNLPPTTLLHINKQEDQRQESVQDYKGEGPIWSHGLQKDHPSQEEKEKLGYRAKVFAKARATTPPGEYRVELGWVAAAKSHQGRGLSRRIIGQLINLAENENLFATTGADARAMRFAADYGFKPAVIPIRAAVATILFCIFVTPGRLNRPCLVTGRLPAELLPPLDVQAVNCPLKFFATNTYYVVGASFRCPGPAVINFNPAAWQTTSRKRRYPNSVYTFLYGY
jgi:GNAT superfamily N-acetyltransferase